MGPGTFELGVQEITGVLGVAIEALEATNIAGFASVTAANVASATAISATVGAEATSTRAVVSNCENLLQQAVTNTGDLLAVSRVIVMPPGVNFNVFRFGLSNELQFSRTNPGPSFNNTVFYGVAFLAGPGSFSVRFDPYSTDETMAGPMYDQLVYMTIGSNPSALACFRLT